ncbi:receptor-like protein 19 isoform X2 [Salvia hispanica]|uniref:receptor-like protein 19 isoform X2 n=1 Tax=Salvia hispanica TaxID=49212 RepID=UPI002009318A|nr:receptor-like protein 19 isoform X2 [Salvia hispanica]
MMRTPHFLPCLLFLSLFQILIPLLVSGQCNDDQRSTLLQLRSTLEYNSTYSTKLVTWNQSDDCCIWGGVGCDRAGRVISLNLENEAISGGIDNSTALFSLQSLESLNLAFNMFKRAQIPKGLQNLTNLSYLNLSNAGFGGQVPIELAEMRSLVTLDLSTLFGGALVLENPNLRGLVQNLPRLRELYLDNVNISAQKSDWCQALSSSLPNLMTLSLRSCGLSGPLDPSLAGLHSLSVLRLDGIFPNAIFQVPTLQILDFSTNENISGTISNLPANSSLRTMVLSYTNMSGRLPDSIGNLKMLSKIEISSCNFTGSIPTAISNLTELVNVDFSLNSFIGSIPPFRMSSKLAYLDLSRNSLTGSLSSNHFEGLSSLEYINLGSNSLNGSIPSSLFGLPSLQRLLLSNNTFNGQIEEFQIPNPSNLDTVDLSGNQLEGSIPDSFFKLEGLSVLSLSSNLFNGTLKLEKVQRFPNLTRLELGYNNLSVDTSSSNSSSSEYPQLSRLNLASCNLSNFPDLRNQSKLIFLDLSKNNIKGEVPSWIWNLGNGSLIHLNLSSNFLVDLQRPFEIPLFLAVLDLHTNKLRGEFPLPPASATYVDYSTNNFQQAIPVNISGFTLFALFFSLANNSLSGTIPEYLCNASYLQVLDLSDNNLRGHIPNCLVKSSTLGVLNLRRNKISGEIPDLFSSTCGLKTLDLSGNNLGGKLPLSMANCTSLEVLNVGSNKIEDTFPCKLKDSSGLRVLVLRNNKFYGNISCSEVNGSWPNLQIIDIASNNFSGPINPKYIKSWKGMMLENGTELRGRHIRFDFLINLYYQDAVTVTIKGLELELVKILTVFTAIDVSCNNFSGDIPHTVGDLSSLYVLNLSHNSFSGAIPSSIGNLSQLGSLDLSDNQLTGKIPQELAKLNFLSFLNLSYNNLYGMIPTGSQFQTFSAENFEGNSGLCGFPLDKSCSSVKALPTPRWKNIDFNWQFIFIGLGYGVGVSLILAPLAFSKEWREKCEEQMDQFLKLLYPRYGFSYVRYDDKVEVIKKYEDHEMTDDDEDDDDEDDEDAGSIIQSGRFCIFCTKLDTQIKIVMHNPNCTCHFSPPRISSTPTSSSSSSLLVIYRSSF